VTVSRAGRFLMLELLKELLNPNVPEKYRSGLSICGRTGSALTMDLYVATTTPRTRRPFA